MNQVTPGLITTGTRFRGSYRGIGVLVTELVECRRPSRIAFHSRGLRMEITGEFVLSADGGGTDVALEADLRPHGALRVVAPLMAPVFRRQNIAAAERLKKVLETPGRS